MLRTLSLATFVAAVSMAGCSVNPFVANYAGRREATVESPRLVTEAPAEGTAVELGTSVFLSSSGSDGTVEAIDAARAVGADLVMVSKAEASAQDWAERDDVYLRRASGQGQFSSYVPLPGSRERWKFTARFWRTTK
jgi:hypothetical protein